MLSSYVFALLTNHDLQIASWVFKGNPNLEEELCCFKDCFDKKKPITDQAHVGFFGRKFEHRCTWRNRIVDDFKGVLNLNQIYAATTVATILEIMLHR